MKRTLVIGSSLIVALFLIAPLGFSLPIELIFYLSAGWMIYLSRVLPQVRVDRSALFTAATCTVFLLAATHRFARWLYAETFGTTAGSESRKWRWRWSAGVVAGVMLMFVAGLATIGIAHQTIWLFSSDRAIINTGRVAVARVQSMNNLKEIGLGLDHYESQHKSFPPACTMSADGIPMHGWQASILPFNDCQELYDQIDFRVPWTARQNAAAYQTRVSFYQLPRHQALREKNASGYALSHYAGNALVLGGTIPKAQRDVRDGAANTISAGEARADFKPWGDPTNWRSLELGINQSPRGFGSPFPGGANFLFVDGSVRFIHNTVAPRVLHALSTPSGGEKMNPNDY